MLFSVVRNTTTGCLRYVTRTFPRNQSSAQVAGFKLAWQQRRNALWKNEEQKDDPRKCNCWMDVDGRRVSSKPPFERL
ncbi:hypothetical protein L484_011690 [Morus notabilis]|uniref:Uncharacterized protein n=1 Tax=Morus notabilis TaxID=981085 RepID=W9QT96_9ROSA|nr:hypothetical protein L484_011690 [Morus notabilis]